MKKQPVQDIELTKNMTTNQLIKSLYELRRFFRKKGSRRCRHPRAYDKGKELYEVLVVSRVHYFNGNTRSHQGIAKTEAF